MASGPRWRSAPPLRAAGSRARGCGRVGRRLARLRVLGRRVLAAMPVMWGVTFLTFVVMNLLPGDAAQALLGRPPRPRRSGSSRGQARLNQPFLVRYGNWLSGVAHGNFG